MRRLFQASKADQSILKIRFLQMFSIFFYSSTLRVSLLIFDPPHSTFSSETYQSFALWNVGLTRRHSPSPSPIHIRHYVSHAGCILSSGEHCFLSRTLDFWKLTFRKGMREILCLIWNFHWPGVDWASNRNCTRYISWRGELFRADNLTTFVCELSRNSGVCTFWSPEGLKWKWVCNMTWLSYCK